jgi:cellulose synthase/poly-beta-1,6-N-acetylglucosamine synthase-like glycosyltransferase
VWLDWVRDSLYGLNLVVFAYFLLVNTSMLVLMVFAVAEVRRHRRRVPFAGTAETYRSPLTSAVSVLMPVYNEAANVVGAVQALAALRYPSFEIVVIDDGSTDDTFDRLREAFDLVEVPRVIPADVPFHGRIGSVHVARSAPDTLVVVRKENGGKPDALNVGINVARQPLVCMVDGDSLLDPDALLSVAKPFADDPVHVVATGGVVRVANGCDVVAGRVVDVRMPRRWLPRIQVVEYLRAFLLGRTGFSRLGGLVIISGAFGLFRRDLLLELGGLARDCIGEDAELVVRLHRRLREDRRDYRVVFVAEPVSWSEAPSTLRVLARQRARWHRGLAEILVRHRGMVANPRYGRIGLAILPFYLVFELLAPAVEVGALLLVPVSLTIDAINVDFAWRLLLVAYGYALLVSLVGLTIEELSFRSYRRWSDLAAVLAAAVVENLGYRQLNALWRLRGAWAAVRRRQAVWGEMTRTGFVSPAASTTRRRAG